jgi:hypothetical protein
MPSIRSRKARSLATQATELSIAASQVVAHRVARLGLAGAAPSDRDRKEFRLMVAEKESAFTESWTAMTLETVRAGQTLVASSVRSFWSPSLSAKTSAGAMMAQLHDAALGVFGKGLEPVHRKAMANAKRLARTKLR